MSIFLTKNYRPTVPVDKTETIQLHGLSWRCLDNNVSEWLQGQPEEAITGRLVKENVKRKVVCLDDYFIKQNSYTGCRKLLKKFCGGSAHREAEICLKLKALGVEVPEILAVGEESRGGLLHRDLLVTREVANSVNLDSFLETTFQTLSFHQKLSLLEDFARFIKLIHEKGVLHADLHLGNILYVQDDAVNKFVLLDVDKIDLKGRPLERIEEIKSFAILLNSVRAWTSHQEQFRFLKFYGFSFDKSFRCFLVDVQKKHLALAHRVWKKKAERCLHTNSRFTRERHNGWLTFRKREGLPEKDFFELLADPDSCLEAGKTLKDGNTVRAGIVTLNGRQYFLKRYNCKGWWYSFRNVFRRSRATRTWRNTWAFHVRNLPVPEPLACFERRTTRFLGSSYLLSEFIPDCKNLIDEWNHSTAAGKQSLLSIFGLLLGEMHNSLCIHGDLKWNNVLIPQDGSGQAFLVDLDGSRILKKLNEDCFRKDLKRFLRDLDKYSENKPSSNLFLDVWGRRTGLWRTCSQDTTCIEGISSEKSRTVDSAPTEKLISVIVPAYNYAKLITRTLDSVLAQWSDDIELIVVNDGSTDDTAEVLEDYSNRYPQVQVFYQDNAGPASARNNGVRLASGRYALMLDADDALLPNAFEVFRRAINSNPTSGIFLAGYKSVHSDGRERQHLPTAVSGTPLQLTRRYLLDKQLSISHGCSLFRRDLLLQRPYPESFRSSEDIPVFAYLLVSAPIEFIQAPVARIYRHSGSLRNQRADEEYFIPDLIHEVFSCLPLECQVLRKRYTSQRYLSLFRAALIAGDNGAAWNFYKKSLNYSLVQTLHWNYLRKVPKLLIGK